MDVQSAASAAGGQHSLPASWPTAALPAHSQEILNAMALAVGWFSDTKAAKAGCTGLVSLSSSPGHRLCHMFYASFMLSVAAVPGNEQP